MHLYICAHERARAHVQDRKWDNTVEKKMVIKHAMSNDKILAMRDGQADDLPDEHD